MSATTVTPLIPLLRRRGGLPLLCLAALLGGAGCFDAGDDDDGDDAAASTGAGDTETPPGSTGNDGQDESDGTGDDAPNQVEACETYCSLIQDHCSTVPQYAGTIACEAVCGQMPLGTQEDTLGNTVGCRTHHTFLAAESPDPHCLHAGPTGDGTCGGRCESFCSLALSTCGDVPFNNDADTCIAACESWDPEPRYTADAVDADTYACRMRHLTLAVLDPAVHCGHIATESPVCQD